MITKKVCITGNRKIDELTPRLEQHTCELKCVHAEDIFTVKFASLEKHPSIASPCEMAYFSSMFFKFSALDWPLRS